MSEEKKLYIVLVSVHGLIRGEHLELGRDPDTGGQITYVLELARALAQDERIGRVDLLTRQVIDKKVDPCYAQSIEPIGEGVNIVRLPCGPKRYLRKEKLWPYLDSYVDHSLYHFRMVGRPPDLVHGHYADGGYIGARIARLLGIPFVFTGHSLGRVKKERMLAKGVKEDTLEPKFKFADRFEAEETALDTAVLVVASTHQEVKEQYELYDHYAAERMEVIPPGVDLQRFKPPEEDDAESPMREQINRFLHEPEKPMILAMARPDERKNFETLIRAYGEDPKLREVSNLVLVAGCRESIPELDPGSRRVMTRILYAIDAYDLHGQVAYPKKHQSENVPEMYRLAASSGGVFVNPALTEPFGLTLLEAAASGLPIVATNDGGPRDIVKLCRNGVLVDPLNAKAIGDALLLAIEDRQQWEQWARQGIEGVHRNYTWKTHVSRYLDEVVRIMHKHRPGLRVIHETPSRLPKVDRIICTDIDNTLLGDDEALREFVHRLENSEIRPGFAIATGRDIDSAMDVLQKMDVPMPDILITSVGTEIRYGKELTLDHTWRKQINYWWQPEKVRQVLDEIPGLYFQEKPYQERFKISYTWDPEKAPPVTGIISQLRQHDLRVKVFFSLGMFLDIVPIRAGDGVALRHLSFMWGIPPERLLVAGDSGNDEEMLSGNTLGVVVGNHSEELEKLRGRPRMYFAQATHARGILEGIDYYNFFGEINLHDDEEEKL